MLFLWCLVTAVVALAAGVWVAHAAGNNDLALPVMFVGCFVMFWLGKWIRVFR